MKDKYKIVIVDDHNIIIDGLSLLLSFEKNMEVVKTYNDGNAFIKDLHQNIIVPDLVLMDLFMPSINGLNCSKIIKKEFPQIKIIILSMSCESKIVHTLVDLIGVEGYLNKSVQRKELVLAVSEVLRGYIHLSSEAANALICYKEKLINFNDVKFSAREKEIVSLMIEGCSNKEISAKLFISEYTVETHRKNIYRKANVNSIPKLLQMVNSFNLLSDL